MVIIAAILVIGYVAKRYVIVIPTLEVPAVPLSSGNYAPTGGTSLSEPARWPGLP
jgi:hypothetical protein